MSVIKNVFVRLNLPVINNDFVRLSASVIDTVFALSVCYEPFRRAAIKHR